MLISIFMTFCHEFTYAIILLPSVNKRWSQCRRQHQQIDTNNHYNFIVSRKSQAEKWNNSEDEINEEILSTTRK